MGFFHKLKVGLDRAFNSSSVEYTSKAKQYGNYSEFHFANMIKNSIPNAEVKTNIIINLPSDNSQAEIDCLVLIDDRLFAIEIKHWKGEIIEKEDGFHKYKEDNYTDDVWEKVMKSPFKQINRAVSMLKKQTNNKDWIQTIVYFDESDSVDVKTDAVWFDNYNDLINYMLDFKKRYPSKENIKCFNSCIAADYLWSSAFWGEKSLHCIIDESSLYFELGNQIIKKQNVKYIEILHHFSSDDILLHLKNGTIVKVNDENKKIGITENNQRRAYNLCKIDKIIIG